MTEVAARAAASGGAGRGQPAVVSTPPGAAQAGGGVLLSLLAARLGLDPPAADAAVSGVSSDSRHVAPGDVFLALPGTRVDGHRFCAVAVKAGAAALAVEHAVDLPVPQLILPSTERLAGPLSSLVYGQPSSSMAVVGVTGTNGKTTTCHLLRACFDAGGLPAAEMATTGVLLGERLIARSSLTTPEAADLQRLLAEIRCAGGRAVALEVSSHGLARHRVDGTRFGVGVFLNLTPEHLDYHGTMEAYFAAKARLFEPERCGYAVVCVDSEWGRRLASSCAVPVTTFGAGPAAQVQVHATSRGRHGISVSLHGERAPGEELDVTIESPLVGLVNAANVAAAYLASRLAGVGAGAVAEALSRCGAPPGRFEVVSGASPVLVVVDYAHTPDALEALLATAHELSPGSVRLVFGARGERYTAKRPEMGRVAAAADEIVLTTDSPGDEPPEAIAAAVLAGVAEDRRGRVVLEPDRRRAIERAVEASSAGDTVLITGRGHETAQRFGPRLVPLDDRVAARLAVAAQPADLSGQGGGGTEAPPRTVAVVIPAHDSAATIGEAIASVLAQSRLPDEVVVVDDGSTDGTAEVALSCGLPLSLVRQAQLGPSAARNAGVAACSSDLVAFLDADDSWHPLKLERQLHAFAQPGVVACATDWARQAASLPAGVPPGAPRFSEVTTDSLRALNRFQTSTVVLRRQAFARTGGFDPELDGAEDWDEWLRLSRLGRIVKLDEPLVRYRDHPGGYSKQLRRHHAASLAIVARECPASSPGGAELAAWHHLRFAVAFWRLGDRDAARRSLRRLRSEHLLAAALPATARLLVPFLAGRASRRLTARSSSR